MTLKNTMSLMSLMIASLIVVAGCAPAPTVVENYDASPFLLTAEPEGAVEVKAAIESSKDQDEIVVVGRIGGSMDPWVKGVAAFSIVDNSLLACSDETEDGETCSCTTPWDYCCESDKLPTSMVLVKFVDSDGKVIPHDAKDNFGVTELDTVFVQGTVKRDESGGFAILASQMFVRK
jgi:hypothetical protein